MCPRKGSAGRETSFTVSKIFVDTNILVYSIDQREKAKQKKARSILKKLAEFHQPVISTQVINEFYVVGSTKLQTDTLLLKSIIHNFRNFEIVSTDLDLIEQGIDISTLLKISFWDSLIIAAAEKANCEFVFSEDLHAGQTYRGVLLKNPFEGEAI